LINPSPGNVEFHSVELRHQSMDEDYNLGQPQT